LAGGVVLAALLLMNQRPQALSVPGESATPPETELQTVARETPVVTAAAAVAATATPSSTNQAEEEPEDPIVAILDKMDEDLDAGDPVALRRISDQLRHPNIEVRRAAREALRYADDKLALPDIQAAADATTDPTEAAELEELIEYLNLPSYTELKAAGAFAKNTTKDPNSATTRPGRKSAFPNSTPKPTTTTVPTQGQLTPEQIAQMQAELERVKRENEELKQILAPLVPPAQ